MDNNSETIKKRKLSPQMRTLILVCIGMGLGLLRYCPLLMPESAIFSILAQLDPLVAVLSGFALGSLLSSGSILLGSVGLAVTLVPGFALAFSDGSAILAYAAMPTAFAVMLFLLVQGGAKRSTIVGGAATVGSAMLLMYAFLLLSDYAATEGITLSDCVTLIVSTAINTVKQVLSSDAAKSYFATAGISIEDAGLMFDDKTIEGIVRMTVCLVPSFIAAVDYFAAYIASCILPFSLADSASKVNFDRVLHKTVDGKVFRIHIEGKKSGYEKTLSTSGVTRTVYCIASAVFAFSLLFGGISVVFVCAANLVIALTPLFLILGYKRIYRLLKPLCKGGTIPIIVVVSLVLRVAAIPTVALFGVTAGMSNKLNNGIDKG